MKALVYIAIAIRHRRQIRRGWERGNLRWQSRRIVDLLRHYRWKYGPAAWYAEFEWRSR